jgi:hypothetical protein
MVKYTDYHLNVDYVELDTIQVLLGLKIKL